MDRFPFDSALIAVSALDHFIFSFVEEFLPTANARGVATIGMKVLGLGSLTHEVERSLRYAFSLPLSTVIVGMETMEQLEQNLMAWKTGQLSMETQANIAEAQAGAQARAQASPEQGRGTETSENVLQRARRELGGTAPTKGTTNEAK